MPSFTSLRRLLSAPFAVGLFLGIATTGIGATMLGSDIFSDVQPGSYYDEAIGEMYDLGIIKGYESGQFGPNDYVTRGQIAVMFQRFLTEVNAGGGGGNLSDDEAPEEEEAAEPEEEAQENEEESSNSSSKKSSSSSSMSFASVGPEGGMHFTIKTYTVNETAGTALISVVRTGGNQGSVSVDYATSDGTATAGSDYTETTGTLNFASKETSKIFSVPIGDDSATEGNETVNLTLTNPKGGGVLRSPATATLTITDNESVTSSAGAAAAPQQHAVMFSAMSYAVQENAGSITITVLREGGTSPVAVNFSASNGTAGAADYTLTNGTLSFAQGEMTRTFSVTVSDESNVDGNKNLTLFLATPTAGAVLGNPSSAILTIVDNETTASGTGSFRFGTASYNVSEGETALITVNRVGGNSGTASVSYATTNGTALSGGDYVQASGTLTFLPGETSKTFKVSAVTDKLEDESEESVNLTLSSPSASASLLPPSMATLKISG